MDHLLVVSFRHRNLLEAIARIIPEDEINIVVEKPSQNVSAQEFADSYQDLTQFVQRMNQRIPLQRVEVRIQEPKFATKKTAQFDITLQIDPYSGGQYIAYAKSKMYGQSLRMAMKQIKTQFQRDHVARSKHKKKSLAEVTTDPRVYR